MVKGIILFIIISLVPFFRSAGDVSRPEPIKLITENYLSPREFYIQEVVDDRPAKTPIFDLLFPDASGKLVRQTTGLYGGDQAIRNFVQASLKRDRSLKPINIRLKQSSVTESPSGADRISGKADVTIQFDLVTESGDVTLTQYRAGAKYTRSFNNRAVIESTFSQVLKNGLIFIDKWMNRESGQNALLAKGVKITFSDYLQQHSDTVYYDKSRPLTWADFKDEPRDSRYTAAVFSSFGYDQSREVNDGIIRVDLALKVYMVKSDSWVFRGREDSYALNHEQRHFDIAKIAAEKFRKKLLSENLAPSTYEGIINFEYIEFYREMNRLQKRYDDETAHGMNRAAQSEWNRNIDLDLTLLNANIFSSM